MYSEPKLNLHEMNPYDIKKEPGAFKAYELGKLAQFKHDRRLITVWSYENSHKQKGIPQTNPSLNRPSGQDILEQIKFLRSLKDDFNSYLKSYHDARLKLPNREKVPSEISMAQYRVIVDGLNDIYQAARFLYQISYWVRSGAIRPELLHNMYFDEIQDFIPRMFSLLIDYCGTGLDLGANYDSCEIARVAKAVTNLNKRLLLIHQRHGADLEIEGNGLLIELFEEREQDFFANPAWYNLCSQEHVERFIDIKLDDSSQLNSAES